MKKSGFALAGIILAAILYYFTVGSSQLAEEMKQQVDKELATMQQNGFGIKERKVREKDEHFVISFDDTGKITNYLNKNAADITPEEMAAMQGLKVGVDIAYLKDTYSAVSVDIYPIALPEEIRQSTNPEEKAAIAHLTKMMAEKKLLVHLDFNKLLNSFKGYVKDINETFEDEVPVTMVMRGFTFKGDVEDEKLKHVQQSLTRLSLQAENLLYASLSDVTSSYLHTGSSLYDTRSQYHIGTLEIKESNLTSMKLKAVEGELSNHIKDGLLRSEIRTKADSMEVQEAGEHYTMHQIAFDFIVENLDAEALEKLQTTDPQDEKTILALSQRMISKGIAMHIPDFSVQRIEKGKQRMEGFTFNSSLQIDRGYRLEESRENPLAIIGALSGKSTLTVSGELFAMIAQDPRSMMLVMFFPPLEKEGKKRYEITLERGRLVVNGKKL